MMLLHWQFWRRQAVQTMKGWRASGLLLMVGYLGAFGLLLLINAWQSYRVPVPAPEAMLVAALACIWWLSVWLVRRPALGLGPADELLLRTPTRPYEVLLGPLLRKLLPTLVRRSRNYNT